MVKSHWPSRPDSLGILSPFVRSPSWEAWCGVQNIHNNGRTCLDYYYSPVCGSPIWRVWDLILSLLSPSYRLAAASSLSLDLWYLFMVGSSVLLSMAVQQIVAILVLLQEERSTYLSTLPSWIGSGNKDFPFLGKLDWTSYLSYRYFFVKYRKSTNIYFLETGKRNSLMTYLRTPN